MIWLIWKLNILGQEWNNQQISNFKFFNISYYYISKWMSMEFKSVPITYFFIVLMSSCFCCGGKRIWRIWNLIEVHDQKSNYLQINNLSFFHIGPISSRSLTRQIDANLSIHIDGFCCAELALLRLMQGRARQ